MAPSGEDAAFWRAGADGFERQRLGRAAGAGEADDLRQLWDPRSWRSSRRRCRSWWARRSRGHALAAMAASTAEPPLLSISIAVSVASGWAVPAAPEQPMAAERLAKLAPEGRSPAWTSGRSNRSAPAGWNFDSSFDAAVGWLKAFDGPTEAMDPAAASGNAAMKERRRKVFSWVGERPLRYSIYQAR